MSKLNEENSSGDDSSVEEIQIISTSDSSSTLPSQVRTTNAPRDLADLPADAKKSLSPTPIFSVKTINGVDSNGEYSF